MNKRISELEFKGSPSIGDSLVLVSSGTSKRTSIGASGLSILSANFPITSSGIQVNGDLNVEGNLTVSTILSSSILYDSGSTLFGNSLDDTHKVTGSLDVTGSFEINGSAPVVSGSISGSQITLNKSDETTIETKIPPGLGYSGLGWARYDDTQYTTSSYFIVTASAEDVVFPNNGGNTIETHMHSSVDFYDPTTKKIQVENEGDVYVMTITFRAQAGANPSTGDGFYIRLGNTSGTPYSRVRKDFYWPKTDTNWYYFHEVIQFYGDSDFVTNGNAIQVHATGVNARFADIIYFIQRTQNHSQH